ncbi:hypothetical protein BH09SUM1_BH09SUM1_27720 [soil metagenome]
MTATLAPSQLPTIDSAMRQFFLSALLAFASAASAAPTFDGVKEGAAAPNAAVLHWNRAKGTAPISYRIYKRGAKGFDFAAPVANVKATDWAVTGLPPGDQEFVVRAADASGEEKNTRSVKVRVSGNQPASEWRGVWFTRFEWAGGSRLEIQKRLTDAMAALAGGNFNSVIFQVRGQGDTLYPSAEEPWSPLISADARQSDPVAFALAQAKKNNLQFHAWINLSVIWQSGKKLPPADKRHPFYKYANAASPATSAWLIRDAKGAPKQWGSDDYVWISHGNPEANAYLRRQVMSFLKTYDVDGLHWDDRTGNPNGPSRDPVSVARFNGRGNPMKIADFGAWQRDQLSRFLSDVYVAAKAKNPRLLISVSPFGIADKKRIPGYGKFNDCEGFGVEPEKWAAMGVVDAVVPQVYWDLPDPEPNYGTIVRDWKAHNTSGVPIWPGANLGKYGDVQPLNPMQARYVAICRSLGMSGQTFFSYSKATAQQWRDAAKYLYPQKAAVPVPKSANYGHIIGTVTTTQGKPIVDAWIALEGNPYIHLSSADGFYGIPNLKPGNYVIRFSAADGHEAKRQVAVVGGKTIVADVKVEMGK